MQRKHMIEDSGRCWQPRELRTPSKDGQLVSAAEPALRIAIERRHERGVKLASEVDRVADLEAECSGRCPQCGERAVGAICEVCHSLLWRGVQSLEPCGHVSGRDLDAAGVKHG